jgi:hypothetical protein
MLMAIVVELILQRDGISCIAIISYHSLSHCVGDVRLPPLDTWWDAR